MLLCEKRKLGVFLNPKTGTQTIHKIFMDAALTTSRQTHSNYTFAAEKYRIVDFDKYKFFCFYRDPVSRFESAVKFLKRDRYLYLLLNFAPREILADAIRQIRTKKIEKSLDVNLKYPEEYLWLSEEIKDYLESLPYEFFHNMIPETVDYDTGSLTTILAHQKHWLDHDIDIVYLNFSDYENELRKLLSYFELSIEEIPHRNATIKIDSEWSFSQEEIELTRNIYKRDYDFLSSKGLL